MYEKTFVDVGVDNRVYCSLLSWRFETSPGLATDKNFQCCDNYWRTSNFFGKAKLVCFIIFP